MKKKYIILLLLSIGPWAMGQTTYNDTVRVRRWSTQLQLGISNHTGMRGSQYVGQRKIAPLASLGLSYNINAVWRFDFNMGYTYLYRSDHSLTAIPPHDVASATPMPYVDRNITHLMTADLNMSFNIMELFHNRRAQRLNMWMGIGYGALHGWDIHQKTWDIESTGTYTQAWSEINERTIHPNSIYIPVTCALEYDIMPELTIGVTGQYRSLPLQRKHTPKEMWYTALTLRYNWGIKHVDNNSMLMQKLLESYRDQAQYRDMLRQAANDNNRLIDQQVALQNDTSRLMRENDSLVDLIIVLRDQRSRLREQVKAQSQSPTNTSAATPTVTASTPTVAATAAAIETQSTATPTETTKKEPSTVPVKANIGDTCIYFDVSSSIINNAGKETIQAVANILKSNPKKKVFIIGYASSTGNADYNLRLSQDRIYAVRKALLRAGVRPGQFIGDRANGKDNMGSTANNRKVKILIKN